MRRIILIWLVMCACLSVRAQYSSYNSFIRKALISYQRNSKGFYERKAEEMLDVVTGVESNYAYDKKAQNLYVLTENSNVVVTLNKDYAKIIKKNGSIPQLKDEELKAEVEKHSKMLDTNDK